MILGIGIDVCSVSRVRDALHKWGDRFWQRILSEPEQLLLEARSDRAMALAGRFAVKEAAIKAMQGGVGVGWHDMQVIGQKKRLPTMHLVGAAKKLVTRVGVTTIHLSITHDANIAAAMVVMEGDATGEPWR